jgi:hypothetical protein
MKRVRRAMTSTFAAHAVSCAEERSGCTS